MGGLASNCNAVGRIGRGLSTQCNALHCQFHFVFSRFSANKDIDESNNKQELKIPVKVEADLAITG